MIAESTRTGNIKAEYVYLNSQPLVKIENNNIYYYHNDYLGTPMLMTDESGSVVWSGEYLPFGEPLSITGSITNNLRFPGQYYDSETGDHYNINRTYDSDIGRYHEADPIGLEGGLNLYVYANANPIHFTDPLGLVVKLCKRDLKNVPYSQGFFGEEYHHAFLWINGKTFGLTTDNQIITRQCGIEGTGSIARNYQPDIEAALSGKMHGSCQIVKCENEENLLKHVREDKAPYYCLAYRNFYNLGVSDTIGINCQEWAEMMIGKYCKCER